MNDKFTAKAFSVEHGLFGKSFFGWLCFSLCIGEALLKE